MILSNLEWMWRVKLMTVFLEFPITVIKRANLTSFQPPRDTMEMKCMITHSPSHGTFFWGYGGLISLAFNAQIHDVVSANGAIVNDDVPSPQSHGVPFFDFKPWKKCQKRLGFSYEKPTINLDFVTFSFLHDWSLKMRASRRLDQLPFCWRLFNRL